MLDTKSFIHALTRGPLHQLTALLDAQPRRVNTFLSEPAPHGPEQWMPMHHAAHAGHLDALHLLLERGGHPDCRTRFTTPMHARQTPLHLAAAAGHTAVIQRLLEAEAEIEVRDAQQRSPLWLAARHHHAQAVEALARRGAAIEARDAQQRTPLHAALLPAPAKGPVENPIRGTDKNGFNPVDAPATFDPAAAIALLTAGADANATCPKEPDGFTALHRCATLGDPAFNVATRLIESGADKHAADPREDRTPHALAIHLQRSDMWIDLLI